MGNSNIKAKIEDILDKQNHLLASVKNLNKKDGWDKFSIISAFISGVLLLTIGGVFTYFFQSQQIQQQISQQKEQVKSDEHRNRLLELDAVSKLLPYLTDPNEEKQKAAYLTLKALASTNVVAQLAKINPTKGATAALAMIATSSLSSKKDQDLAGSTLEQIFLRNRSAVVKVRNVDGGQLSEASGFFVTKDGYILTAGFAVSKQSDEITIVTLSGKRYVASFVSHSSKHGFTILKVSEVGGLSYLSLAEKLPKIGENILVIGSTGSEHLISAFGEIKFVTDKTLDYTRDRDMLGFAGGPILDSKGEVVGYHRGRSTHSSGNIGEGRRLDKNMLSFKSMGLSLP